MTHYDRRSRDLRIARRINLALVLLTAAIALFAWSIQ